MRSLTLAAVNKHDEQTDTRQTDKGKWPLCLSSVCPFVRWMEFVTKQAKRSIILSEMTATARAPGFRLGTRCRPIT